MNRHACIIVTKCNLFDHYMIHETTKGMQIIIPLKTLISKVFHNYNNFIQTFYKNKHKIQFNNTD